MTIEQARETLGEKYQDETEEQIQAWIDSAIGLTEVFFQQFGQKLNLDTEQKNEQY